MRRLRYRAYGRSLQAWQKVLADKEMQKAQSNPYAHIFRKAGCYLLLGVLTLGFCYLFCLRSGVFGAKVDWISQHSVLPEYFRQQFYQTGELFPEFSANIGGGENIYNFAYYGLYNPLLLPSYLLPFVKMSDYMMSVQFIGLMVSVFLMYQWLVKKGFSERICVGAGVLFLLSGPMIFHSYNQIMFVNYMPFLLMGFLGVDGYFEKRGRRMLVLVVFLMIMTSFYFSIGGMLALVLYGIHRCLMVYDERGEKITVKAFCIEGLKFSFPFVTAVMMSGVLLVPTALALTGRKGEREALRLGELLMPEVSLERFFYSPYGIGMTTLALTALIALLFGRKRHERVLALSCMVILTVPVFAYLLNGGLYVRNKVMIPFLPLLCYILAYYLDGLKERNRFGGVLPYLLTIGMICLNWQGMIFLDGVLMLVCFLAVRLYRTKSLRPASGYEWILLAPSILMLIVCDNTIHTQADRPLDREFYSEMTDTRIRGQIKKVTDKEDGFYRTEQLGDDDENAANLNRIWSMGQYSSSIYSSSYHGGYRAFREETFRLEEPFRNFLMQSAVYNPVYQRFMGVKYVVSKMDIPGYKALESNGRWKVHENDQVSPVAYGTDRVIPEEEYRKLDFPYNQLALLKYAVVKESAEVKPVGYDRSGLYEGVRPTGLSLPKAIDSDSNVEMAIDLPDLQEGDEGERVLFLRFRIENQKPSKDIAVWVEGIRNKLTARNHFYYNDNTEFTYAVPLKEGQETVEMIFGKGSYEISEAEAYIGILPVRNETDKGLYQSEFMLNQKQTKGNRIEGIIDAKRPGYFVTTIPYDENFEVLVDRKPVKTEEVNTAFLGFRMGAGKHRISIVYHAPGVKAGKIMSIIGILLAIQWIDLRKKFLPFSGRQIFI